MAKPTRVRQKFKVIQGPIKLSPIIFQRGRNPWIVYPRWISLFLKGGFPAVVFSDSSKLWSPFIECTLHSWMQNLKFLELFYFLVRNLIFFACSRFFEFCSFIAFQPDCHSCLDRPRWSPLQVVFKLWFNNWFSFDLKADDNYALGRLV